MFSDVEKTVWYRYYVLFVLLVVCICNLATRNLPSYLITVPVPDCADTCGGVDLRNPICGWHRLNYWPQERAPTEYEGCQLCRARVTPLDQEPQNVSVALPRRSTRQRRAALLAPDAPHVLYQQYLQARTIAPSSSDTSQPNTTIESNATAWPTLSDALRSSTSMPPATLPWNAKSHDATYYNLADGACLYRWEYGLLIGYGFALVFAVGAVPAGKICDSRSRVVVASASLMIWSVATSLQAAAHTFWFLLGCRAAIGLAQAFAMPAAISLTADYFMDQQNCAVGILSVGLHLGSGCASFSILFAEVVGWRWAVFIAGLIGIAIAPVLYWTVIEPARTEWSAPCHLSIVTEEVFEKSRVARMLIFAGSAKMLATYSLSAFLPIWYSRRDLIGYTNSSYACWNALVVSSGGLLSAMTGSLLSHWWSQRDWRAPCWLGVAGAVCSTPLIIMVLQTPFFTTSMICLFFLQLAHECWYGPIVTLVQASVRRSVRSQAVSIFLVATTLAGNVGPALVGFLDPGTERIGAHLLWISVTANVAAAVAFAWTAWEITVDPVAAGLGNRPDEAYQGAAKNRAGTNHWVHF